MQSQHLAGNSRGLSYGLRPKHPILDLPLTCVIRPRYALTLQHVLKLYTVGNLLGAWRRMDNQKTIEDVFDTPEQAHHAIATCATWAGFQTVATPGPVEAWWHQEDLV